MKKWLCFLWLMAGTSLFISASAQTNFVARSVYPIDQAAVREIGKDLYEALKPTHRFQMSPSPLWIREDARFSARPFQFESEKSPTRIVYLSDSFLQLAHSVAHAKAVERIEPGFFAKYVAEFSRRCMATNTIQGDFPPISDPRHWSEDIMNEQAGYFSQIVSVVAAMDLAHHYLGHYEKYGERLRDSAVDPTTIAGLCTENQWRMALQRGAGNALDCGFSFEGIKAFYDLMEGLERRPPWTLYFLPVKAGVAKTKNELDQIEARFFGQK